MQDPKRPREPPLHLERSAPDDSSLGRALALVRLLRERCPWDARQDPRSLRPYLLEEAHEVADVLLAGDDGALAGELGDLLLNLAFQIVLAEERGAFAAPDVVERLEHKMAARHPHIYGGATEPADWEALKAAERRRAAVPEESAAARDDPFAGLPTGLEPLGRALRTLDRAAASGFEWPDVEGPMAKLEEEMEELRERVRGTRPKPSPSDRAGLEAELGDLLLAAVGLARRLGVHPSDALLAASARFRRRFRTARRLAGERGIDWEAAPPERLEALWREAKRAARP